MSIHVHCYPVLLLILNIDTAHFSGYAIHKQSVRALLSPYLVRLHFLQSGRMHPQEVVYGR